MTSQKPTISEFPTLKEVDFIQGLRIVQKIESGNGQKWSPFERGKYLSFSGIVSATKRLGMDVTRFDKNMYDYIANNIDSLNTNPSYQIFVKDPRVAKLIDVVGQRYSGNTELLEVTRGTFAIYRTARIAFGEEEIEDIDLDLLLRNVSTEDFRERLSDLLR